MNNNTKILLVSPKGVLKAPPVALGYLSATLKKEGFEAEVLDLCFEPSKDYFANYVDSMKPDIVGFTGPTSQVNEIAELSRIVKKKDQNIPTLLGGVHATAEPYLSLTLLTNIDAIVTGEGEIPIVQIARRLQENESIENLPQIITRLDLQRQTTNKTQTHNESIVPLDNLPFPHLEYKSHNYDEWDVYATRGCPYNCTFCACRLTVKKWRTRSVLSFVDEIEDLLNIDDKKLFYFNDTTFHPDKFWLKSFCAEVLRRKLQFSWQAKSRVDTLDEEIIDEMKAAGLVQLRLGVESGSQKILDYYNKNISVAQIKDAFSACHNSGVEVQAYIMMGAPIEKEEDIEQTMDLVECISPDVIMCSTFIPLPGSFLYKELGMNKQITKLEDWSYATLVEDFEYAYRTDRNWINHIANYPIWKNTELSPFTIADYFYKFLDRFPQSNEEEV